MAVDDLNNDGHLDVIVANSGDGTVVILFGVPGGQLGPSMSTFPAGNDPSEVDAVDIDNDRDVDLVIANHETSRITVLLNDGQANFAPAPGSPFDSGARPHIHGLATGDFNGDGWNDVAVESADTHEIRILNGHPDGFGKVGGVEVGTRDSSLSRESFS